MSQQNSSATQGAERTQTPAPAPMAGIRVLDMARVLAGPWIAQLMADFGADVIKIERPGSGDDTRTYAPAFESTTQPGAKMSSYFASVNRGKRSITIDFSKPEGAAIVRELALEADVLIENYVVGTMARYGLDYTALAKINPRLIYISVTGFGQDGPYASRPGYDAIVQGAGGLMGLTGEPDVRADGSRGSGPIRVGMPITDVLTGTYGAFAVASALRQRDVTGAGQYIDLALLDTTVFSLCYSGVNYFVTGKSPERMGNGSVLVAPANSFRAADGWIAIMVGNNLQFERFCGVLDLPGLLTDPRFAESHLRVQNVAALEAIIVPLLAQKTVAHWVSAMEAAGVPCGPINDIGQLFADPQVIARGIVKKIHHPVMGDLPLLANPLRMSNAPVSYDIPPPMLGEQTESILAGLLGKSAEEIAALKRNKIV
jgi:crotonobetainyl-CoA:carnitine CoA-transferase CaiB-like acyl-CoA transferase